MTAISKDRRVAFYSLRLLSSGSCRIPGSRSGVPQDKQDSVLRPSVSVRTRDASIEVAEGRIRHQRVRLRGGGLEHKHAEFTPRTGN